MDEIKYSTINFGPLLLLTSIDNALRQEMLDKGLKNDIDWTTKLAGQIEDEKSYSAENIDYFGRRLVPYFEKYFTALTERWHRNVKVRDYVYYLDSLWINVQKENEYNPVHSHSGDISFVIYLDISNEIYEEKNKTTSMEPGAIGFIDNFDQNYFGDLNADIENIRRYLIPLRGYEHIPKNGEMFIFPSYLTHHVQSFKTPGCRRVSVSGNISIKERENKDEIVKVMRQGGYEWQDEVS